MFAFELDALAQLTQNSPRLPPWLQQPPKHRHGTEASKYQLSAEPRSKAPTACAVIPCIFKPPVRLKTR